jgi:hypothetical protein
VLRVPCVDLDHKLELGGLTICVLTSLLLFACTLVIRQVGKNLLETNYYSSDDSELLAPSASPDLTFVNIPSWEVNHH